MGNKRFDEFKPWQTIKTDAALCANQIAEVAGIIEIAAATLEPFVPFCAAKVKQWLLNVGDADIEVLFKRLDMAEVKQKFAKYF